jgi:hypothetical protein
MIQGETPLQKACSSNNVTNLDFVEYLLKKVPIKFPRPYGTDTIDVYHPFAPGAAKFLLNSPTTDVSSTIDLESVLDRVRSIDDFQIANSWSSVA